MQSGSNYLVLSLLRRLPFTIAMAAAILVITAVTGTLLHPITSQALTKWGFGLDDLYEGHSYNLFYSAFQVFRPYMFLAILASLLLFLGACEYMLGTWRAALSFWVGHIIGYLGGLLVLIGLGEIGVGWAQVLVVQKDVGASNGAFCAAGVTILYLPGRFRKVAFFVMSIYLAQALVLERNVWDVQHIIAFLGGLGLGAVFLHAEAQPWPGLIPRFQLERRQRPTVISWAIATMGIVNVMAAFVIPHSKGLAQLESWLLLEGFHAPRHLLLASGCALLVLAPGLSRGQRVAWWGALAALLVSLGLHLQVGVSRAEPILASILILMLFAWRKQFVAPSDSPSLRRGERALGILLVGVVLYGVLGFFLLRTQFSQVYDPLTAFKDVWARVVFSGTERIGPVSRRAEWFLASIPLLGWGGLVYCLTILLRGTVGPKTLPRELEIARTLLTSHGRSTTAYMTLSEGNSLFFDSQHECYIAYRVNSRVAIALGDPVGPERHWTAVIRAFAIFVRQQGWDHVFYSATPPALPFYRANGYQVLQIGEDAVIQLGDLEYKGKEWQNIRTAMNRAKREGVTFEMYEGGTIPFSIRSQLVSISEEWVAQKKLPQMGFTLGRTEDVDNPDINVAVATDGTGRVHAFVDWLPIYALHGWVIDLMRRRSESMVGVMEFLIGMSLLAFKERGYRMASLSVAPMATLDRDEDASILQKVVGRVYEHFDAYYSFKSLFAFKDKFQPQWEGVYLAYSDPLRLPAISLALLRAYLPDLDAMRVAEFLGSAVAKTLFPKRSPDTIDK